MTLLLVALSLLPPAWLVPWSADLAAIAWFPLRPLERALSGVRSLLRRSVEVDPSLDERAARLSEERDRYRGLWFAEQLRAKELTERLEAIEEVRRARRALSRPVSAQVLGRAPTPDSGILVIDAGSDAGVATGDPVVVRGDMLVGRVVGAPTASRAHVAAIGHPTMARIDALVVPGGDGAAGALVPIQLVPAGGGIFNGEVTLGAGVSEGDEVRLADPSWPAAAQGLRIGRIRLLEALDRNPLRLRAEIEPEIDPQRVGVVVVQCEVSP